MGALIRAGVRRLMAKVGYIPASSVPFKWEMELKPDDLPFVKIELTNGMRICGWVDPRLGLNEVILNPPNPFIPPVSVVHGPVSVVRGGRDDDTDYPLGQVTI